MYCIKEGAEDQKDCLGDKKEFDGKEGKKQEKDMSICIESVLRSKMSARVERTPPLLNTKGVGNHVVITPTTMAAKAPKALNTFLDPPPVLLLLLPFEVPEGFEPLEVPLGEPELELPEPGVAEGSG